MKKGLLITLDVLLYLVGFPLLLVLVILEARTGMDQSYGSAFFNGFSGLFPIIFTVIMLVIALVVELILRLAANKTIPNGKSSFKKQAIKMAIAGFAVLTGLFVVIDCVLAPILTDATDGTLKYEDLADDYNSQHLANDDLIDFFIEMNVPQHEYTVPADNGSITRNHIRKMVKWCCGWDGVSETVTLGTGDLTKLTLDEYLEQGMNNEEVVKLMSVKFQSIDSAYTRFDKVGIDLALDGIMPMDVVLLLLPVQPALPQYRVPFPLSNNYYFQNNKLAGIGAPQSITITDWNGDGTIDSKDEVANWFILDMLGEGFDLGTLGTLGNKNVQMGTWDYQMQAWLNSVGLLGIITGLFSVRKYFYIFGAVVAIASILRGMCRKGYSKLEEASTLESAPVETPYTEEYAPVNNDTSYYPYQ